MSKTGRGILRDPGPYFCLYSSECVEEEFCELRLLGILGTSDLRSSEKFGHNSPLGETWQWVRITYPAVP
jgi:hypothetical protein